MLTRTLAPRLRSFALPLFRASYSSTPSNAPHQVPANDPHPRFSPSPVSATNAVPTSVSGERDQLTMETVEQGEKMRKMQAPNREGIWSRSQVPREKAMSGPRFEQMIMGDQPRPYAAIELIHKQPVRWTKERTVSCDGGGGPLGHPRIFINVDKPQITPCTYCGLPFAHEKHRETLKALPHTSYPLEPTGDEFEVGEKQRITDEALGQR
ncbi:hypothetical protein M011DRAFT_468933 [Sporormia fimetaria CBS 119925]|uniref:Zinc finger CHCC-type domain-containing protein n=1 Tax=Sporormia fimetaria CBS 119925 TaxID=1340428 RepID=A0A6A6V856_9PLEO|nr:hypothetical protein M011DRAFT_468933 [Sporormia fimetaria CBS 119925]